MAFSLPFLDGAGCEGAPADEDACDGCGSKVSVANLLVVLLRNGFSNASFICLTLTCPKPGRFCIRFASAFAMLAQLWYRKVLESEGTRWKAQAYSECGFESLYVCLVDLANAGEGRAQDRVVVLVHALLDHVRRSVLELLEGREIVAGFFDAVDLGQMAHSSRQKRRSMSGYSRKCNDDCDVIDEAGLAGNLLALWHRAFNGKLAFVSSRIGSRCSD